MGGGEKEGRKGKEKIESERESERKQREGAPFSASQKSHVCLLATLN